MKQLFRRLFFPVAFAQEVMTSRDMWRADAKRLARRVEQLALEKSELSHRIAGLNGQIRDLNAQLCRARMVQMADYTTGRQP